MGEASTDFMLDSERASCSGYQACSKHEASAGAVSCERQASECRCSTSLHGCVGPSKAKWRDGSPWVMTDLQQVVNSPMLLADPSTLDKLEGLEALPVMDAPLEQRPSGTA